MNRREEVNRLWKSATEAQKLAYIGNTSSINHEADRLMSDVDPLDLMSIVEQLNEKQKEAVELIGFGSVLNIRCPYISRKLCQSLISLIDPETRLLTIHGMTTELTPAAFQSVMGFHDRGMQVFSFDVTGKGNSMKDTIVNALGGDITLESLRLFLVNSVEADDTFKIVFVMYSLATVLCPLPTGPFESSIIVALSDTNSIYLRDWASFCLGYFIEGVRKFHGKAYENFSGSLLFLQLFLFATCVYQSSIWSAGWHANCLNWSF